MEIKYLNGIKYFETYKRDEYTNDVISVIIDSEDIEKSIAAAEELGSTSISIGSDFESLDFLREYDFTFVRGFVSSKEFSNYKPLESLNKLVSIGMPLDKKASVDLISFPDLVYLSTNWVKGILNFESCYKLKHVEISGFSKGNLEAFSLLNELEILKLYSSKLENLIGLKPQTKLKELDIDMAKSLVSMDGIQEAYKTLERLRIWNAPNLYDASEIGKLKNLKFIQIAKVKNLKSLNFLNKLNKLDICNIHKSMVKVEDGNYTYLEKFKNKKT